MTDELPKQAAMCALETGIKVAEDGEFVQAARLCPYGRTTEARRYYANET
ncbi:hypothetical protein [Microvirga sp. KLBC 81]|nr:hypothetical protein [Microvirga sp. KLBC 81]